MQVARLQPGVSEPACEVSVHSAESRSRPHVHQVDWGHRFGHLPGRVSLTTQEGLGEWGLGTS